MRLFLDRSASKPLHQQVSEALRGLIASGKLAVGEANDDAGGTFPIVCQPSAGMDGIVSSAQWMWYWLDDGSTTDAFHSTGVNTFRAFLIFRLGASVIIE